MASKLAKKIFNATRSKPVKIPEATPLGSPGYDNPRDDIEKVKKLREGSVIKTPVDGIDIVNKLYSDSNDFWQRVGDVLSPKVAAEVNLGAKRLLFSTPSGGLVGNFILDFPNLLTLRADGGVVLAEDSSKLVFWKDSAFVMDEDLFGTLGTSAIPWKTIFTNTLDLGTNTIVDADVGNWNTHITHQDVTTTASPTYDELTLTAPSGTNYTLGDTVLHSRELAISPSNAGVSRIGLYSFTGNESEVTLFRIYGKGKITEVTGHNMLIGWITNAYYVSTTEPLKLSGGGKTITLDTGGVNVDADLTVSGDLTVTSATNVNFIASTNIDFVAVNGTLKLDGSGKCIIQNASGTDIKNDLTFVGAGSGLPYGTISVVSNATETTIDTQNVYVQVTNFDTNGPSNNTSPSHTNDHITVTKAGIYKIECCITANSIAGAGATFEFEVKKNNGDVRVGAAHGDKTLAGGGSEAGSITICTIATLAANDTVELWTKNESNTQNIIIEDASLSVVQWGG